MIASMLLAAALAVPLPEGADLVVKAAAVHVGNGTVLAPGYVVIGGGKILAVSAERPAPSPGVPFYDLGSAVMAPGFIEGASHAGLAKGDRENEEGREFTPGWRVSEVFDPRAADLESSLRQGVTSLVVHPGVSNVIAGLSCWVKLRGPRGHARVERDSVGLRITLGTEPAAGHGGRGIMNRRPSSRMSTVFEIRYHMERVRQASLRGASGNGPPLNADDAALSMALAGRIPVLWKAATAKDVWTAIRISREFGIQRSIIVEAQQAEPAARDLAQAGIPVLAGPLVDVRYQTRGGRRGGVDEDGASWLSPSADARAGEDPACEEEEEECHGEREVHASCEEEAAPALRSGCNHGRFLLFPDNPLLRYDEVEPTYVHMDCCATGVALPQEEHDPLMAAARLWRTGVDYGFAAGDTTPGSTLLDYVRFSVRNGLDPAKAIPLLTLAPARILGLDDRVGSIEPGKDADLVLFDGDPLSPSSRIILVIIDGQVVQGEMPSPRPSKESAK